jgi:uncharacterized protein YecE (DUF72 family)
VAEIRIGASGWHYKHWRGPFYPPDLPASQMLAFYLERFDTVEINNSFYRLPKEETFTAWHDATPPDFRFAVKGSRFITHNKKLKDPQPSLDMLMPRVARLGPKLGPILFQLPPLWTVNLERLEQFLTALPQPQRYAFEFRNPTWNIDPVYRLLRTHNAAYCIFHLAGFESPLEITADYTYIRLHGPGGKYQGSYSDQALETWAARIHAWRDLAAVYVYFDNDQAAYAVHNALSLRRLVAQ